MGKRGPKMFEESTQERILPMRVISQQLGISLRTVESDYRSAVNKLRRIPGAFEIILANVHAVDASEHDPIQCASVECNSEFIKLFGGVE